MYFGKGSVVTFLVTSLFIELSNNFADCLIELSGYEIERMKFEMEFLNYFDKRYQICQQEYDKDSAAYEEKYWTRMHESLSKLTPNMEEIMRKLKMDITCVRMTYEIPIARQFATIAVHLGAFGAHPVIGDLIYTDLKQYLNKLNIELGEDRDDSNVIVQNDLPYEDYVNIMHYYIFKCYEPTNNHLLRINRKDRAANVTTLNAHSSRIKMHLRSILFAVAVPGIPGLGYQRPYSNERLWKSTWKVGREMLEPLKEINLSAGESSGSSKIIQLLREIEKLKMRNHKPKIPEETIADVVMGFNGVGTLAASILYDEIFPKYIQFSKLVNRETGEEYLADGQVVHEYARTNELQIEPLKKA